jgi:hypothetical protein
MEPQPERLPCGSLHRRAFSTKVKYETARRPLPWSHQDR